jgi:hypothetical protein
MGELHGQVDCLSDFHMFSECINVNSWYYPQIVLKEMRVPLVLGLELVEVTLEWREVKRSNCFLHMQFE